MARNRTDVHPAALDELPQVVSALSKAFFSDPNYRWIVPDDAQRRRSTKAYYSVFAEACWPHGGVYTDNAGAGGALWLPPGDQLVADEDAEQFVESLLRTAGNEGSEAR